MRSVRHNFWLLALLMLLAACSGLAGEPEIVATLPPRELPTAEPNWPQSTPDLANGAQIFAQRCASCHGPQGDGQGELVLSGEIPAMPSFLDAPHVSAQLPADYFDIITNGRIENLMPPWREALTPQQRWDVTYYVYTLHYTEAQIATGEAIYQRLCAECHGDTGLGDGPEMTGTGRDANNFQDLQNMSVISDDALFYTVLEGVGEAMPAYQDELSEDEIRAVNAYSRLFSLSGFEQSRQAPPSPEATEEAAAPAGETVTISGQVSNGSAGAAVPAGLNVELRYGNMSDGIEAQAATIGADGSYTFTDIPRREDYAYAIVAFYQDRPFISDQLTGEELSAETPLDLTIYEPTEDPFVLTLRELSITIERMNVGERVGLVFGQQYVFENNSDRVFTLPANLTPGALASLLLRLPPGAVILPDTSGGRYLSFAEEYAVVDTQPIYPGEHIAEVFYFLPYENGAIVDQPLTTPFDGTLNIQVAPESIEVRGDNIALDGTTQVNGQNIRVYTGSYDLPLGESLRFELAGTLFASANTSQNPGVVTADSLPLILGGVVLLLVIIGGGFVFWQRRSDDRGARIDALARQIAELDAMHDRGEINHDVYQQQRLALKQRLAELLSEQNSEPSSD